MFSKNGIQSQGNERKRFLNQMVPGDSYVWLQFASSFKGAHFFESAYVFKKVVYAGVKGMESENQIALNACLLSLAAVQLWASQLNLSGPDFSPLKKCTNKSLWPSGLRGGL